MNLFVLLSLLTIAIITQVTANIQIITDDTGIQKPIYELMPSVEEFEKNHQHPGRKERCFFTSGSSSVPSRPNWDIIPRIQNVNTGQGPRSQQGRPSIPSSLVGAYQYASSYK